MEKNVDLKDIRNNLNNSNSVQCVDLKDVRDNINNTTSSNVPLKTVLSSFGLKNVNEGATKDVPGTDKN